MIKELLGDFFNSTQNISLALTLFICVLGFQSLESLGISKTISKLYKSFEHGNISDINKYTSYFIALYIIISILYIGRGYIFYTFYPKIHTFISNRLYKRIILSYQKNFEHLNIGEVTSKFNHIPHSIKSLASFTILHILPDMSALVIILGYIFMSDKKLFIIMIISIMVMLFFIKRDYNNVVNDQTSFINQKHVSNGVFYEKVSSLFEIYVNNSITTEFNHIRESEITLRESESKTAFTNNLLSSKIVLLNILTYIILIGYILFTHIGRDNEQSLFYLTLYGYFFRHTKTFGYDFVYGISQYNGIKSQAVFINKLFNNQTLGDTKLVIDNIKFVNVDFKYPDTDEIILKRLDIEINRGDKFVIFGKSGSGKSTIFKVLMGFFSPNNGSILVNNTNIDTLDLAYYRNQIAYISQDTKLFDMTVLDNIKYNLDVSNTDVYNIMSKYNIHTIYERLDKGLDTMAGVDGNHLSGGQRQMVIILRALLKRPEIYLFDEPTSSIDPNTKIIIYNIIKDINATVLIISHDVEIKKYVKKVYNLRNYKLINE